ncbi:WhiB family transcriptional regulator [Streptomyces cadmiisoli]|uniref:WhiB family transcriptional regulator n=1 Tax=Streptomyces cadmiisoli TaxID=2184053 RepID=UPI003D7560B6
MDREWELKAACRSYNPEIWFSKGTWVQAKGICIGCPVREACLEATLDRESLTPDSLRSGIFAGLTGAQRAELAAARAPEPPVVEPKPVPKKRTGGRQLAPCGTPSAYERHLRKGEPIDQPCRDAHNAALREYRRTGSKRLPVRA